MRLEQTMRDAIHMYDQCVIALGHDPEMAGRNEEIDAMIDFLEEERNRLRSELKDLENGTHELFAPFKAFLESNDPDAAAIREHEAIEAAAWESFKAGEAPTLK